MIAKVGDEAFGRMITSLLTKEGVDTSGVVLTSAQRTSLAFVLLGSAGEREFIFYRDNAADMFLESGELDISLIEESAVLHVNTVMLLGEVSRRAQALAVDASRRAGRLLSVDLNFRRSLWADREEMITFGRDLVAQADIVKLTEDELDDLVSGDTIADKVAGIWRERLKVCAVTKGAAGADLFTSKTHISFGGFPVAAVDTTGAGDAFTASLLSDLTATAFDLTSRSTWRAPSIGPAPPAHSALPAREPWRACQRDRRSRLLFKPPGRRGREAPRSRQSFGSVR
jgi:fructokinase